MATTKGRKRSDSFISCFYVLLNIRAKALPHSGVYLYSNTYVINYVATVLLLKILIYSNYASATAKKKMTAKQNKTVDQANILRSLQIKRLLSF